MSEAYQRLKDFVENAPPELRLGGDIAAHEMRLRQMELEIDWYEAQRQKVLDLMEGLDNRRHR